MKLSPVYLITCFALTVSGGVSCGAKRYVLPLPLIYPPVGTNVVVSVPFLPPPDLERLRQRIDESGSARRPLERRIMDAENSTVPEGTESATADASAIAASSALTKTDTIALSASIHEARRIIRGANATAIDRLVASLGSRHPADQHAQCYDYRYYEATLQVRGRPACPVL